VHLKRHITVRREIVEVEYGSGFEEANILVRN